MPRRVLLCAFAVAVALVVAVLARPMPPAGAAPPPAYVPPVDAPVVDPFRVPAGPYGPGNRGLEYGTAPGAEVRASADGVVVFAGFVAGTRHVTILHSDGLRTSYSFLARIDVVAKQRIRQGATVGTTTGHLHLGARAGDAYLDPAGLFGAGPVTVHLVPFDEPPGPGASGERSAIRQLLGGVRDVVSGAAERAVNKLLSRTGATADWLRQSGGQVLRTAAHYMGRVAPGTAQLQLLLTGLQIWAQAGAASRRPCTAADQPPPPPSGERRVAVLVGGLGSTSTNAAIDEVGTSELGYATPDVVRFSYAGGRIPDPTDGFATVPPRAYSSGDTQVDLRTSGSRLADLIEQMVAAAPGAPIDLYAHSQGGLVLRLALIELEARHGAGWVDRIGLIATLGTPHGGADLATAIYAFGSTQAGSAALDGAATALGLTLDDDAPAAAQLAETSDLVADLANRPLPVGLEAVSIAARGDLVVPVPRTEVAGATQVVVPVTGARAHDALPGSADAQRELALALAGRPPTCTSFRTALTDQLIGEGISWAEDTVGSWAWLAAARRGAPLGG